MAVTGKDKMHTVYIILRTSEKSLKSQKINAEIMFNVGSFPFMAPVRFLK